MFLKSGQGGEVSSIEKNHSVRMGSYGTLLFGNGTLLYAGSSQFNEYYVLKCGVFVGKD